MKQVKITDWSEKMFDEPINSVQKAKEYFRFMGCLHFHMAREFPKRYEEYKQLNIPKQTEIEWITEQLDEYYRDIIENKNDIPLWTIHSRMYDLVETLKTDTALNMILEVTQRIREKVSYEDRVIISETINGRKDRKYRSGLIYLSYDLNDIFIAKAFIELSQYYSIYEEGKSRDLERCQSAAKICNDIKNELKL
ncbi:MAG: hypothetical protein ACM3UU_06795 [Ignavibacteriales bacterium]